MGSQPSHKPSIEESKNQIIPNKKKRNVSINNSKILKDYNTNSSKTKLMLKTHQVGLYEEEVSISDVVKQIIKYSVPAFLGVLIRKVIETVNYMAIGNLGDSNQINGAWFALTSVNFVCVSNTVGLAGGIETLSSHAFGSGNNYLAGCQYHRAFLITTLMLVVMSIISWNIEGFLVLINQPEESAEYTAKFLRIYLPGMLATCHVELIRRYLSVQGIYNLILIMQIIAFVIHLALLYYFSIFLKLGIYGVAISSNISNCFLFCLIICYISLSKETVRENSWHCPNKDSFKGIFEYLRYAIPSLVMLMAEDLCFELLVLFSGNLGTTQQSAYVLIISICGSIFMISLGISIAASNLVGNALGANKPNIAKTYARIILYYSVTLGAIISIILYVFRYKIASLYTNNEEIRNLTAQTIPIISLFMIPDFVQGAGSGIIKAMGYQNFGAYSCIFCYWFVGVPTSLVSAFYFNFGAAGMRLGLYIAIFFVAVCFLLIISCSNWEKISIIAHKDKTEKQGIVEGPKFDPSDS